MSNTIASVHVGTFGGDEWERPETLGDRTDITYDAAGRVQFVTDPMARLTKTEYDLLGRTVRTFENYVDGTPSDDTDKRTDYAYGPAGMTSLTAWMNATDFQTTAWIYGFTSGSLITNDLVRETHWPKPTSPDAGTPSSSEKDAVTINALGQTLTRTDRNGTVHGYAYDVLGRLTDDTVTTLGTGVDGAVRRISTEYDPQGNAFRFTSFSDTAETGVVNQVQRGCGQFQNQIVRIFARLSFKRWIVSAVSCRLKPGGCKRLT